MKLYWLALESIALLPLVACGGGSSSAPPPVTYTIGGTVSGLDGSGLVLQNNGGNSLAIAADAPFTFSTPVARGVAYEVTVLTEPANPAQACSVANSIGIARANVTDVQVACVSAATNGSVVTGNWQLTVTSTESSTGASYGTSTYGIYLTQTGSAVSGIVVEEDAYPDCWPANGPPCAFPFGTIDPYLAGTVDAAGSLVLNSNPAYSGGSFSMIASTAGATTANTAGATLTGTYSTVLVTTNPAGTWSDQGTVSGTEIGVLNGTYKGTITSPTGAPIGITTTLQQTADPDAYGLLEVTGLADFTGSSCFASATIPASAPAYLTGNDLEFLIPVPTNNPGADIGLFGTLSADTKTLVVSNLLVTGGTCDSDLGSGTLTLQ